MSSVKEKATAVLDPGNFLGTRGGGVDLRAALDPGSHALEAITGSDLGYRVNLVHALSPRTPDQAAPGAPGLTVAQKETAQAKKDKLARYSKLRTRRPIMTTEVSSEDTLG